MYLSGMLLFLLVIGCNAANETSRFLSGNGFEHLVELFSDQEIEVRQIPALPDQDLNALWVRTIGARMRHIAVCFFVYFHDLLHIIIQARFEDPFENTRVEKYLIYRLSL